MRAILVILSALGAAFLVMGYVRSWQMRKAIKTGKPPEAIDNNYILGRTCRVRRVCAWRMVAGIR